MFYVSQWLDNNIDKYELEKGDQPHAPLYPHPSLLLSIGVKIKLNRTLNCNTSAISEPDSEACFVSSNFVFFFYHEL